MHTTMSHGAAQADQAGKALLAQMIRDGLTDEEIMESLRLRSSRAPQYIAAVRQELTETGVANCARRPARPGRKRTRPW